MNQTLNNNSIIGIYGGTFDPIHYGHLRTALELKEGLGLDYIRFIPALVSPHCCEPGASPQVRLAMIKAAIKDAPEFMVDTQELYRTAPSFTVDTLTALRAKLGQHISLCLLLGMDAFLSLPDWHEPQKILTLAHLIVAHRPGWSLPRSGMMAEWLQLHQDNDIIKLHYQPAGMIMTYPVTALEISARAIRNLIAAGKNPRFLLPDAVLSIIHEQNLYTNFNYDHPHIAD